MCFTVIVLHLRWTYIHTYMHMYIVYQESFTKENFRDMLIVTVFARKRLQFNFLVINKKYGTAQFKLDRTQVQHVLDTTHFSFHTRASIHVHARLMMSNLLCKALVYTRDMCTTVCRCTRVCQE